MSSIWSLARSYVYTADYEQAIALAAFDPCEVRFALFSVVWSVYTRFIEHVRAVPVGQAHLDAYNELASYQPGTDEMGRRHLLYAVASGRCDLVDAWSAACPQLPWVIATAGDPLFTSMLPTLVARTCSSPAAVYRTLREFRSPLLVPYVNDQVIALSTGDPVVRRWLLSYGFTT